MAQRYHDDRQHLLGQVQQFRNLFLIRNDVADENGPQPLRFCSHAQCLCGDGCVHDEHDKAFVVILNVWQNGAGLGNTALTVQVYAENQIDRRFADKSLLPAQLG